jgi:hypothetical protein
LLWPSAYGTKHLASEASRLNWPLPHIPFCSQQHASRLQLAASAPRSAADSKVQWRSYASSVYRRADNARPVSFTGSAWEWVYATDLSRLQRETSKRHVEEAHSVLTIAILLPQRLSCYWGKIVSLRMLTNLRLADLRLTTAQQRSTGQNLPSDLYRSISRVQRRVGLKPETHEDREDGRRWSWARTRGQWNFSRSTRLKWDSKHSRYCSAGHHLSSLSFRTGQEIQHGCVCDVMKSVISVMPDGNLLKVGHISVASPPGMPNVVKTYPTKARRNRQRVLEYRCQHHLINYCTESTYPCLSLSLSLSPVNKFRRNWKVCLKLDWNVGHILILCFQDDWDGCEVDHYSESCNGGFRLWL